jgi:hypothetical protein
LSDTIDTAPLCAWATPAEGYVRLVQLQFRWSVESPVTCASNAKLSPHKHIPCEEGYKSIGNGCWKKSMHVPTIVSFFVVTFKDLDKCPRCGPAGTRTMTFTVEEKPL